MSTKCQICAKPVTNGTNWHYKCLDAEHMLEIKATSEAIRCALPSVAESIRGPRNGQAKQPSKNTVRRHILEGICPFCTGIAIEHTEIDYSPNEDPDSIYVTYECNRCHYKWLLIFNAVGILCDQDADQEEYNDVYLSNWSVNAKHPRS